MLSKIIKEANISKVSHYLGKYNKMVIVTHVSPDGDALGSSLGLYHYLKDEGNEVTVVVPNTYPSFLNWMPGADTIVNFEEETEKATQLLNDAEVIFCLDFNTAKRTSKVAETLLATSAKKVMVDHHPYPDDFCNVTISHPEISSTSELIFRLICRMGDFERISRCGAECIYTGMMTDTGGFTYNSNSPEIYSIIGKLLNIGIDKDQIYRNVFNNYTVDRFRLQGFLLSEKLKVYEEYKTVMIHLTHEEQQRFHMQKGDTEGFANMPLSIAGIKFSIFFREDVDMIKISLRSQGDFPCNQLAEQCFGGGGHLNASGAEFRGPLEEAIAIFEKTLPEYISYLID